MAYRAPTGSGPSPTGPPETAVPISVLATQTDIPEEVCEYLIFFKRAVLKQEVAKIAHFYEYGFAELTEKYYRDTKMWPSEELVAQVVGKDDYHFIYLYKELYYRYVYGKNQRGLGLDHRFSSYQNYNDLFLYIVEASEPVPLSLPNRWLWDIIDEFVYQFQSFCQYKANPSKRGGPTGEEEMEELRRLETDTWNLYPVLNILYSIIERGKVMEQMEAAAAGRDPEDVSDEFGASPLYFRLGYFATIGLMRIHILLGDFRLALHTVRHIDLDPKGLYNSVPSCLVTLHYYIGFCHMMCRRYADASHIFVNGLLYIQRTRNHNPATNKSWQYDVISKTNDQLFQLLGICIVLSPQRIDESIQSQLGERLGDRMARMRKGDVQEFEAAFTQGCPKFLAPNLMSENLGNISKEPLLHQTRIFSAEIQEQVSIPLLRGYLSLYSSITIPKLAAFMEVGEEELIGHLLSFKHKLSAVSASSDDEDLTVDLDFYIDRDMIHVADTKVGRRHGEYFIRHINKLQELNESIKRLKLRPEPKTGEQHPKHGYSSSRR